MSNEHTIDKQLKAIGFNIHGWGRGEVRELANIILPDEEILECVNGIYEGGFALLLSTDIRVLLVDKKPLNFLTIEDLRFDMINEIDYNHRLLGADITIATGNKYLKFRSYNQPRLRKLINHVQHLMAQAKRKQLYGADDQTQHLERINQQLQTYLFAQYDQHQRLQDKVRSLQHAQVTEANAESAEILSNPNNNESEESLSALSPAPEAGLKNVRDEMADLYSTGMEEIFGGQPASNSLSGSSNSSNSSDHGQTSPQVGIHLPFEVHPLRVAYAKLPTVLKERKLRRAAFGVSP